MATMLPLVVITAATMTPVKVRKRTDKVKGYVPTMPRSAVMELTAEMMASPSLKAAAAIARKHAATLPQGKGTWAFYMVKLADALESGDPYYLLFKKGNAKLPFWAWSTLPQFTCPGAGECLSWCYSFHGWRYPAPWARQLQNTLLLRFRPDLVAEAFQSLPQGTTVRLYVDGDFDCATTVAFWMGQITSRPDLNVYGYSKSWQLLWEYAKANDVPVNYVLNLSTGGSDQGVTRQQMQSLPFVRGDFIALPVQYQPTTKKAGNIGSERYQDPEYHRAVRKAAAAAGLGKVFSCPGDCGDCCGSRHACGQLGLSVPVVIGIH